MNRRLLFKFLGLGAAAVAAPFAIKTAEAKGIIPPVFKPLELTTRPGPKFALYDSFAVALMSRPSAIQKLKNLYFYPGRHDVPVDLAKHSHVIDIEGLYAPKRVRVSWDAKEFALKSLDDICFTNNDIEPWIVGNVVAAKHNGSLVGAIDVDNWHMMKGDTLTIQWPRDGKIFDMKFR